MTHNDESLSLKLIFYSSSKASDLESSQLLYKIINPKIIQLKSL